MTTIAFRDGIMAADTQETAGESQMRCKKIFRATSPKGRRVLIGTAGGSFAGMIYVDHFKSGKERPITIDYMDIEEDFHNLIWDGTNLFEVNWLWRPIKVPRPKFFAIGSGAPAALGAMHMGASAKEAVNVAKKIDIYTGGRVVSMKLNNWEK
jgi:ATP-dependent protease HslVU (ClpYQ) peptidase subunit